MYPILFKIGNICFYTHGILMVVGILFGVLVVYRLATQRGLDCTFLFDNIVFTTLAGIIGARITYFLLYPKQFDNALQVLFIWQGGLVSYGGFVISGITLYFLLKSQKQPILDWFDILAVGFPLGLFFGRLGDILAGDYANAEKFQNLHSFLSAIPLPLYEALLCLAIFFVVLYLFIKKENLVSGFLFSIMLLLYTGGRFIIDFYRTEATVFLGLSYGQIFSLLIFIISLFAIVILLKNGKKGESYELNN